LDKKVKGKNMNVKILHSDWPHKIKMGEIREAFQKSNCENYFIETPDFPEGLCFYPDEVEIVNEENMDSIGGIKVESGEKREFNTGAKKQASAGKGTPVLFPPDAYLEISKHFEEGAFNCGYGPRNWEKGIPLSELINSLERHIAQEKMGLIDERHDRALAWNAVVYLATKLRIQVGILPAELNDLYGAYGKIPIPVRLLDMYCEKCQEKIRNAKNGEAVAICKKCAKL